MFKAFCDRCEAECDKASNTRQFDKLKQRFGLQIIPLHGNTIAPDRHVCDSCVAELLLEAATRYPKVKAIVDLNDSLNDALDYRRLKSSLEVKERNLVSELGEVTQILNEAKSALEQVKTIPSVEKEKIMLLEATISTLESKITDRVKREEAAKAQQEADEKEYPEYGERVSKRERIRAS